ncbi:MAG: SurA N-terminal domain-containing protein [Terriglobales bacterium]
MIRTSTGRWTMGPAILMVALVVGLAGCNRGQTAADVMAKVNGRKILRSEVDKYYAHQTANSPQQPSDEQSTSLKLGILKELIDNEILMQRAEKLGLLATNEEVDQKLNEIKAPYTQEEFDKRLNERKITLDDFKRDLRRSITIDKVLNREIASKISISDADITSYYNAHKAEFNLIEPQYHLAHIFVTTQPNSQVRNLKNDKAQNETDARKKVQMIMNRLDSGEDFASVAMNYSEDPESAGNGGDLGFTPQSALAKTDPATRDAVSKLKPGQYSNVIVIANPETHQVFGFRIVKLITKEPAGQRELGDERVKQAIRDQLRDRREQLLKAAYYDVVRDQAKVENYYAEQILKSTGQK